MKEKKQKGYIAGGSLLFLAIFFGYFYFTAGRDGLIGIISIIFTILGIGGVWKPESFGQVLHTLMKNLADNQKQQNINQNRNRFNKSPQSFAQGNVYNIINYGNKK